MSFGRTLCSVGTDCRIPAYTAAKRITEKECYWGENEEERAQLAWARRTNEGPRWPSKLQYQR